MKQKHSKRTTQNTRNTSEKHACPKSASKQNQGTGNNRFDPKTQKPTGPQETKDKNTNPKNRIWSMADYDASPAIEVIINTLDISKTIQGAEIINTMHERFSHFLLDELKERGIPYGIFDGQTFTIKLTFMKERPEAP